MSRITFFVRGLPKAQPRVKFSSAGKFGRAYTPGSAKDWKALVMEAAQTAIPQALDGPTMINLSFYFPRPKSHFNSRGELKATSPTWHTTKPDRDNLDKCVLDGLKSAGCLTDDCIVCDGRIQKLYARENGITGVQIEICQTIP